MRTRSCQKCERGLVMEYQVADMSANVFTLESTGLVVQKEQI